MGLASFLRPLIRRRAATPDALWRLRVRYGQLNAMMRRQLFASDARGYNIPLLANPFSEARHGDSWRDAVHDSYIVPSARRRLWADGALEVMFRMIDGRVNPDDVVLEVGCNAGYVLEQFRRRGYRQLCGIEPMKHSAAHVRATLPEVRLVEGLFGPPENDVRCDLMVFFGTIFRIPYALRPFDAIDRCAGKYVLMRCLEGMEDFYCDPHVEMAKRGFLCIEKHCLSDDSMWPDQAPPDSPPVTYAPIGRAGADGPLIELGAADGSTPPRFRFRSFMLFRRIEPRPPAPKVWSAAG